MIALRGPPLRATRPAGAGGFAVQTGLVLEYRRLRERDDRAAALERADATSTAILRAVSHDLRTPLATMRAAVDGLVSGGRPRRGRPAGAGRGRRRRRPTSSSALIDNLLDLSRLQSGLLHPVLRARSLEEILPLAVAGHPPGSVVLELEESAPLVLHRRGPARAGRRQPGRRTPSASPTGTPVRVRRPGAAPTRSRSWSSTAAPACPRTSGSRMFEPFQRLDDTGVRRPGPRPRRGPRSRPRPWAAR